MGYIAASDLNEALAVLAAEPASVIAGGTDWFPAQGDRHFEGTLLDITRIRGLRGLARNAEGWRIGAATTWTDIIRADLPPAFDGLKRAAREVGSVQIQNTATVAGNLCNASPAADGVPPLLTLDAQVELSSQGGTRQMPLSHFLQGVRKTARRSDEMLTAILIPAMSDAARGGFLKLGARKYLVISICMVGVIVTLRDGILQDVRIAVGAASPVAQRLGALEAALEGVAVTDVGTRVTSDLIEGLSPITDVRATATYRQDAVVEVIRRALLQAMGA
jgi:CO/xanthine dehydrogenase FAD-binding subunit